MAHKDGTFRSLSTICFLLNLFTNSLPQASVPIQGKNFSPAGRGKIGTRAKYQPGWGWWGVRQFCASVSKRVLVRNCSYEMCSAYSFTSIQIKLIARRLVLKQWHFGNACYAGCFSIFSRPFSPAAVVCTKKYMLKHPRNRSCQMFTAFFCCVVIDSVFFFRFFS